MKYRRDKYGSPVSVLGYGCMRFSKRAGSIDTAKTEKEILKAVENGVNYFDTAYIYTGSEAALGEILERNNLRSKVNIATKLPQYLVRNPASLDQYFNEELKRLRTDHVDYYLMHMLTDLKAWENLKENGAEEWIAKQKQSGRIRNIGFSYHGNTEMFLKILDAYDWDFCQIQYNYMDEHTQAGRAGLKAAREKGIPVVIMEPLRGGKLVSMLPKKAQDLIASTPYSPAELAFRWLYDQEGIMCVLSGMNSIEMVEENCRIASSHEPGSMKPEEFALIEEVKKLINEKIKVPCTACGYCQPCPRGVDIPLAFRCYNEMYMENKWSGRFEYAQTVGLREDPSFPSQCVACGKCESHCPQHIHIIEELKNADKALRPFPYGFITDLARKFILKQ